MWGCSRYILRRILNSNYTWFWIPGELKPQFSQWVFSGEIPLPHSPAFREEGFHLEKLYASPWISERQLLVFVAWHLPCPCLLGGQHTNREHLSKVALGYGDTCYFCSPASSSLLWAHGRLNLLVCHCISSGHWVGMEVVWFTFGAQHVITGKTETFQMPVLPFCNGNQQSLRWWLLLQSGSQREDQNRGHGLGWPAIDILNEQGVCLCGLKPLRVGVCLALQHNPGSPELWPGDKLRSWGSAHGHEENPPVLPELGWGKPGKTLKG